MTKGILFLALFAISGLTMAQDNNCFKSAHEGKFTLADQEGDTYIIRKGNKQIEVFNGGRSKFIEKIVWSTDSTYTLIHKKGVNVPNKGVKGERIECAITRCEGDRYHVEFKARKKTGSIVMVKVN